MLFYTPQQSILTFYLGVLLISLMCHTPIVILRQLKLFYFNDLMMKYTPKIRCRRVRLMLSEQVLARWQRLVAFRKAKNLLHWVMHTV
jgi:hypothetical protein